MFSVSLPVGPLDQRLFGSPLWPNAVLPRPVPFRVSVERGCTCRLCDTFELDTFDFWLLLVEVGSSSRGVLRSSQISIIYPNYMDSHGVCDGRLRAYDHCRFNRFLSIKSPCLVKSFHSQFHESNSVHFAEHMRTSRVFYTSCQRDERPFGWANYANYSTTR